MFAKADQTLKTLLREKKLQIGEYEFKFFDLFVYLLQLLVLLGYIVDVSAS